MCSQRVTAGVFLCGFPVCFLRQCLTEPRLAVLTSLTGHRTDGVLPLQHQRWGYRGVLPHLLWCECWGSKVMASGSCSGPLLTELSSLLCVGICYCHRWEAFNWTLDGRAPFLSYTFTLLVLLSFLTMNLCESPPETCYWHLQNFESNLFKPFIKLICFMYFTIVMKMD